MYIYDIFYFLFFFAYIRIFDQINIIDEYPANQLWAGMFLGENIIFF